MDIFAITKTLSDTARKIIPGSTSTFVASEYGPVLVVPQPKQGINVADVLSFLLGVVIGLYAAYLSWQCNSKLSYSVVLKVIFALFAYIFGLVYLILYVVMRWDTCRRL